MHQKLSSTGVAAGEDGRIPFRIRIAVTGHRDLSEEAGLRERIRERIRGIYELLPSSNTEVMLSVISQLADGADRMVVREAISEAKERDHEARLEVILPLEYDDYVEAQDFSIRSRNEFDRLLRSAVVQPPQTGQSGGDAYEAASRRLVARCDVLVAIWDGQASRGRGGTAETLLYAAARSKPCVWIPTHPDALPRDNFGAGRAAPFHLEIKERAHVPSRPHADPVDPRDRPNDALEVLRRSHSALDDFNRERASVDFESRLRSELASHSGVADWVAAPFARATTLATRWRARFTLLSRLITLSATTAAVMLAVALSFGKESEIWSWAEAGFFVLALFGVLIVRRVGFHGRWLSYRVLAERLRTAHFLAPTGADFQRQARLEAVYVDGQSTDWLMRAFEEVWDRRPANEGAVTDWSPEALERLKTTLADDWIGEQIVYHRQATRRHRRAYQLLAAPIGLLFLATIAFACLHSLHQLEDVSIFFSVVLPAIGASLGVLLTVNQHQALSERYARMRSDLIVARRNILDATAGSLVKVSSDAARVIAQETGAWFGSMWFLDIEHP
jgi:uncharacterized membrane protein YbhN (UPF0104 family)